MSARVPTFRGQNFEFWKLKLVTFLESKRLEYTLRPPAEIDNSWVSDEAKARMYILEAVDDEHLEHIMPETSARSMVNKLESMYSVLSDSGYATDLKKDLRDDFLALKMTEDDDPSDFFQEFESYIDMLDDSDDRLSPKEILNCLLMAVCQSYRHLFDDIDRQLEPLEVVKVVKKKILAEYGKVNGFHKESPEKANPWSSFKEAFKDESQECHRCGQSGHWARKCPQPVECYKCGQEGHLKSQCTQPQSCYGCGQEGHRKFECPDRLQHHPVPPAKYPHRSPPPSRRAAESASHPAQMAAANPPNGANEPTAEWILDSCATYHSICDKSLFSTFMSLETPINVDMPNGHVLSTSKVGEVRACFRAGNRFIVKVLPKVYLIEEFEQNLLSVQRLVQFGGSVILKSTEVQLRDASNQVVACGKKINNLYVLKSYSEKLATPDEFDSYA